MPSQTTIAQLRGKAMLAAAEMRDMQVFLSQVVEWAAAQPDAHVPGLEDVLISDLVASHGDDILRFDLALEEALRLFLASAGKVRLARTIAMHPERMGIAPFPHPIESANDPA